MEFKKGDIVRLTLEAARNRIYRRAADCERTGTITGISRDGTTVLVVWAGNKSATAMHKSYLEVVP